MIRGARVWSLLLSIVVVLVVLAIIIGSPTAGSLIALPKALRPVTGLVTLQAEGAQLVPSDITVEVHPMNAPVTSKVLKQFVAKVNGTSNQAVTWYVDGIQGGTPQTGTIDVNGLYTPANPFTVSTHVVKAVSQEEPTKAGIATAYLTNFPGIYTNRYGNGRGGLNSQETILTPTNVNVATFGKVFSYPIDGGVHAQPLYVANVYIPNPLNGTPGYYNVVYVATEHDSVFAFDADGNVAGPLWVTSFINPPTVVTIPGGCFHAAISEIGTMATPVINPATKAIYVEARTLENPTSQCVGKYVHKLHALDITTGQEKFGGPVTVQGSVPGTGAGSVNGVLYFNPKTQNVRPGLLLSKTSQDTDYTVFFGSASLEDIPPFHGWVLGYDSRTLAKKYIFCTTPNGNDGGIWQMGGGLAADGYGNIFVQTGNGSFDNKINFGESVLKLTPSNGVLALVDYFTPDHYILLNRHDWDVSSGGLLLLPLQAGGAQLMVGGGKEGTIYVMNRNHLGGYNPAGDQIVQEIVGAIRSSVVGGSVFGIWGTASYFQNKVYIFGEQDYPKMFQLNNGSLPTTATSVGPTLMKHPNPTISASGGTNGIVWILQFDQVILWAYDPNDLTHEYYDTHQDPKRDRPDGGLEAVTPTVANGRVYVATRQNLDAYGLLQ
jgi:hypothetical protein